MSLKNYIDEYLQRFNSFGKYSKKTNSGYLFSLIFYGRFTITHNTFVLLCLCSPNPAESSSRETKAGKQRRWKLCTHVHSLLSLRHKIYQARKPSKIFFLFSFVSNCYSSGWWTHQCWTTHSAYCIEDCNTIENGFYMLNSNFLYCYLQYALVLLVPNRNIEPLKLNTTDKSQSCPFKHSILESGL